MKCAIYVRVSTDEQVKEGFSIPAQKERLKAFCLSQGWDIVEEYIEEGWSAKNLERPIMQRMLKDIKHKDIDIILVYRLDRLTRSVLDLYNLLQVFEKNDVSFKSATEVYDTSTAMGRLFITLVAALAQWERENLAERVKFGIEQMIDEGKKPGGHSPFGYQFDKHFNCTIIENEAAVVKKIFTWYANGYGYRTISNNLNHLKVKPRLAKEWNFNSVREILINDMYIGVYRWGSKVLYDHHPPIISKALFDSVRKRQSQKTTNSSRVGKNPLTGVLKCGTCDGYPMQGYFDKRDQKLYYRCLKCKRITWDKRILEPLFDEINNLITSKDYFISKMKGQRKDSYEDLDRIQAEIEKVKAQKEKWYDVFEDENNPIPKDVLFTKINKLNVKEQDLNMQLNELDVDEESPDEKYIRLKKVSHLTAHYHKSSAYHQRELLHSIFESVVITREKGRNKPILIDYTLK